MMKSIVEALGLDTSVLLCVLHIFMVGYGDKTTRNGRAMSTGLLVVWVLALGGSGLATLNRCYDGMSLWEAAKPFFGVLTFAMVLTVISKMQG